MERTSRGGAARDGRAVLIGLMFSVIIAGNVRADRIVLRGGGQVRGKIVPDPKKADRVLIVLDRGKTPLSVLKEQVVQVIEEPGPLDGYVVRRSAAASTAPAQFDLGLYCDQHKLTDLARLHFETAVKLDPAFGPAREKLGHAKVGERWLSGDELREAQGFVKYKGRWVTAEEKERHEKESATNSELASWARRIKVWRDAIVDGPEDRAREAESQLMAIREPGAVPALVRTLGNDGDSVRSLMARVLGAIPGRESATALAQRLVAEEVDDVRGRFLEEITRRNEPESVKALSQTLRTNSSPIVNRAAWALSHLNAVSTVPNLIGALVTTRQRVEMVYPGGAPVESPTMGSMAYGPGIPMAFNGSQIAYMTPPAVAPGAVAFGAYSVPLYANPYAPLGLPNGVSFGVGGGMGGGTRGPVPRTVTDTFQNMEVLSALVKLTGEDFGYNVNSWRNWLRTSFRPDPELARRVPQP